MKKTGILNSTISELVASLGHTDTIVVCDAGLPIPSGVQRIDLALRRSVPGFIETVETLLSELKVESFIVAQEMEQASPQIQEELVLLLEGAKMQQVPHSEFKELTRKAAAIIRTGEFSFYANVILVAGVAF